MPRGAYDAAHEAERRRQLELLPADGSARCPRCGRAMFATPELAVSAGGHLSLGRLDLDDFPGLVFGGPQIKLLSHRRCNRQAGAIVGNRLRGMRRAAGLPTAKGRSAARPRW